MGHVSFGPLNLGHGPVEETGDHLAGSLDESIARQFDDTEGGGFADETTAVLDPTQAASPQTERDLRVVSWFVSPTAGRGSLFVSDELDRRAPDHEPPTVGDNSPYRTPDDDGQWFSGLTPLEGAQDVGEDVVSSAVPGLPWWVGPAGVVAVLALLAVAFGQLFTVGVGGEG